MLKDVGRCWKMLEAVGWTYVVIQGAWSGKLIEPDDQHREKTVRQKDWQWKKEKQGFSGAAKQRKRLVDDKPNEHSC